MCEGFILPVNKAIVQALGYSFPLALCSLAYSSKSIPTGLTSGSDAFTQIFAASETISSPQDRVIETREAWRIKKNNEFSHPGPTVKYVLWPLGSKCTLWLGLQQHTLFKTRKNAHLHLTAAAQSTMPWSICHPTPCHVPFFFSANPLLSFFFFSHCKRVDTVANGNVPLSGDDEKTGQGGSRWPLSARH